MKSAPLLGCLAWAFSLTAQGVEPSTAHTARLLVQTVQLDSMVATTTNGGVHRQQEKGRLSAKRAACIARFVPRDFTAELAALVQRKFTEEEMTQVIEFYRTPLGRKLLLGLRHMYQKEYGDSSTPRIPEPRFTKAELAAETAFGETPGGKKALEDNYFVTTPEFQAVIARKALAAKARCQAAGL